MNINFVKEILKKIGFEVDVKILPIDNNIYYIIGNDKTSCIIFETLNEYLENCQKIGNAVYFSFQPVKNTENEDVKRSLVEQQFLEDGITDEKIKEWKYKSYIIFRILEKLKIQFNDYNTTQLVDLDNQIELSEEIKFKYVSWLGWLIIDGDRQPIEVVNEDDTNYQIIVNDATMLVSKLNVKKRCSFCKGSGNAIAVDGIHRGKLINPRPATCDCCDGTGIPIP